MHFCGATKTAQGVCSKVGVQVLFGVLLLQGKNVENSRLTVMGADRQIVPRMSLEHEGEVQFVYWGKTEAC